MKRLFFAAIVLFFWNILPVDAQDLIILRDGNVIEAKVAEISPTEIRYRRFSHLNGPIIVIPRADVLSIKYENGTTEIMNPASTPRQGTTQSGVPNSAQSGETTLLQQTLNRMPAITIAGNSLKFEFRGDTWISRVNGENFSTGTIEYNIEGGGGTLTLKQTHVWPGAVGKTAGKIANVIPGGGAASGALNTAGTVAGASGPVEMPGTVIVLEYKEGPPASLKLVSSSQNKNAKTGTAGNQTEKYANVKNNWISLELTYLGIGLRYERMLNANISIGANFNYGFPPMYLNRMTNTYCEINAFFRGYPWGKTFFLGIGLGYNYGYGGPFYQYFFYNNNVYVRDYDNYVHGFTIIPEIGWKIDIGKPGGFYLMPCLTFPVIFGSSKIPEDYYLFYTNRIFYLGMGFAF